MLDWSFTTHTFLLLATSTFGLGRCSSSPQWWHLHRLCPVHHVTQRRPKMSERQVPRVTGSRFKHSSSTTSLCSVRGNTASVIATVYGSECSMSVSRNGTRQPSTPRKDWTTAINTLKLHTTVCPKKSEPLNILQQQPQICSDLNKILHTQETVSYAHLTLPTIYSV